MTFEQIQELAKLPNVTAVKDSSGNPELMATSFMTNWTSPMIANGPLRDSQGFGTAPTGPGLGIEIDEDLLGEAILTIE